MMIIMSQRLCTGTIRHQSRKYYAPSSARCCRGLTTIYQEDGNSSWRQLLKLQHDFTMSPSPPSQVPVLLPPSRRKYYHSTASSSLQHNMHETSSSSSSSAKLAIPSETQRRSAQLELDQMTHSTSRLLGMMTDLKTARCSSMTTTTVSSSPETPSTDINDDQHQVGPLSDAIVNEARVALHYWSRRWYMHFHPGFGRAAKGSALALDALRRWDKSNYVGDDDVDIIHGVDPTMQYYSSDAQPDVSMMQHNYIGGDYGARQAERLLDWSLSNNLVPRGIFDLPRDTCHMEKEEKCWTRDLIQNR